MAKYEVARFFRIKPFEVNELSIVEFSEMIKAMEIISARERLLAFEANSYSQLKDSDRQKLHRSVSKLANPEYFDNWVSSDEAVKILKQRGF